MSASDALKRLAEKISVVCAEFRKLHSENQELKNQIQQLRVNGEVIQKQGDRRLRLVENPDSSLHEREQVIAKLEEMLEELEQIV